MICCCTPHWLCPYRIHPQANHVRPTLPGKLHDFRSSGLENNLLLWLSFIIPRFAISQLQYRIGNRSILYQVCNKKPRRSGVERITL